MFLKIMGAMPGYIFAQDKAGIYVNLFIGCKAEVQLPGRKVVLQQKTNFPWQGNVKITIEPESSGEFNLNIRIPDWCQGASSSDDLYQIANKPVSGAVRLKVNGQSIRNIEIVHGYAQLHRQWKAGDIVELSMDMPVHRVKANSKVEADKDRVALMRGPIIYCLEGVDNNGTIQNLFVPTNTKFTTEYRDSLLRGVNVISGRVTSLIKTEDGKVKQKPIKITMVPYYTNSNRSQCEMQVWLPEVPGMCNPSQP